ncbi:dNA polymerase III gamma and tau subunits homolog [Mycoplasma sp. CAG:956]|nr:dNA polymerase III gamma and tau subunits homolog [Mycoplasma sp. CAG:956]
MDYQVLYRKYRPHDFDSLVGQEYTKKLLKNSVINNKFAHAYIFTGPRGTGKTSSAKIFAKAINCLHPIDGNPCNKCQNCVNFESSPDIIELDAASNNGVDDIREIINNVRLAPSSMKIKVYIIDEFHMLSTSAFNALLLTLEEPPKDVVFILATTDIQSVPITVLSRCQRFDFKPISIQDIENRLKFVCGEENLKVTDDAIKEIAMMSNGGLRDALSILDQVAGNGEEIDIQDVIANFGGISNKKINQLLSYYENNSVAELIDYINEIKNDGIDIKVLIDKIITKIKSVLIDIKLDNYNGKLDFDNLYNLVFELNKLLTGERNGANYYDLLEIVFLKYINYFPGNNFVDKNIAKLTDSKKESAIIKQIEEKPKISAPAIEQTIISQENKPEKKNKVIDFDIDVRINNTFVNAKKDYLNNIKSKWNDFVIYESNTNKAMISYLADTNIVAASDKYAILTNNLDITNDLINQNIKSLEKDFNLFFNGNYYLVAVSPKKWEQERNKYINNIKNGYKYEIIDNDIIIKENKSELEKIASEIFGNNYKKIE